jgi:phenylacetaldehyde dehydrogenase
MSLMLDRESELTRPVAHTKLLIDGEWVDAADGGRLDTFYPGDGRVYGSVAEAQAADVDRAVRAARRAFDSGPWRRFKPAERAAALWRLGDLILRDTDELARLETLDTGKPNHAVRRFEVPTAAGLFHYMSGWATKIEGSTIPISFPGEYHAYSERDAIGVVGLIVPWNFPLVIASWKLAPALAAGNTVVVKPAEWTPLTALHLGALALEAGIPEGVFNVVPGYGPTAGAALTEHPLVDKVSFTGSTATGRTILRAAAGNLKRVTLELGGKSPNVVFADADLDAAIAGSADGVFGNAGQACAAASRLFVQESVYDEVVAGIASAADRVRVADAYDDSAEIGPLASKQHFERVTGYLDAGRAEGVGVVTGGDRVGDQGFFLRPTVLADTSGASTVSREEIFGPVVVATPFRDIDDLLLAANGTSYGLAAGVWTRDVSTAHRVARGIKSGTVWVNCYSVFDASLPFGGMKQSGWGREMGREVLHDYTEVKAVCVKLGD